MAGGVGFICAVLAGMTKMQGIVSGDISGKI